MKPERERRSNGKNKRHDSAEQQGRFGPQGVSKEPNFAKSVPKDLRRIIPPRRNMFLISTKKSTKFIAH